jgi:hypothetical protein
MGFKTFCVPLSGFKKSGGGSDLLCVLADLEDGHGGEGPVANLEGWFACKLSINLTLIMSRASSKGYQCPTPDSLPGPTSGGPLLEHSGALPPLSGAAPEASSLTDLWNIHGKPIAKATLVPPP